MKSTFPSAAMRGGREAFNAAWLWVRSGECGDLCGRFWIFVQAGIIMLAILTCVWELHLHLTRYWIAETPPSLAVACLMLQAIIAIGGVIFSGVVKKREERRRRKSQRIQPVIRERLASYCLAQTLSRGKGNDLARLKQKHRDDFEACLIEFLNNSVGQTRQRLSRLCTWLGFVEEWKRRAMGGELRRARALDFLSLLSDETGRPALIELISHGPSRGRAAAMRALTRLTANQPTRPSSSGSFEWVALFHEAVASPRLIRAMLATDLRAHAQQLVERGIPELLEGGNVTHLQAALEMMEGWSCGLPLSQLTALILHPDVKVRASAMRLAPLDSTESLRGFTETARTKLILAGLCDQQNEVRTAALHAAAALQLQAALPLMEQCAENSDRSVASAACKALASMGAAGRATLARKINGSNSDLAASAAESLGRFQLARAVGAGR